MSLVFEDPPGATGPAARFRERSPERKQMDELLTALSAYTEQWARLYDLPDKDEAEKLAGKVRSAAAYLNTGKGWSVAVRETPQGWSVFAKQSSEPPKPRAPRKPKQDEAEQNSATTAEAEANTSEVEREPTFQ